MGVIGSAVQAIRGGNAKTRDLTAPDFFGTYDPMFYDVAGENALRIIAVYAAVSQVSDALSSLPIRTYRREKSRLIEIDPPLWLDQPDDRVSDFDWVHQGMASALLRGNAYGVAYRDKWLRCTEVDWQHPTWVTVDESDWLPKYNVRGKVLYNERTRPGGGLVHIPGFVMPGSVQGRGPVTLFRQWFEMSRNAAETAREWYGERAMPASVLSSKAALAKGSAAETQEKVNAEVEPGKIMVIDGANWDFNTISLSPADMLFLDAIQASATQIAAIFRVEPEDVGGKSANSLKYTTVEGNQRKFNLRTLMSWARRFEQGLKPLLDNPATDLIRFDLDELARPDAEAMARIMAGELEAGTLTLPEARDARGRGPLTDSDIESWQTWYRTTKGLKAADSSVADMLAQITTQTKGN